MDKGVKDLIVLVREDRCQDGSFQVQLTTVIAHSLCSAVYHSGLQKMVNEALKLHLTQVQAKKKQMKTPSATEDPQQTGDIQKLTLEEEAALVDLNPSVEKVAERRQPPSLDEMSIPDAQRYVREYFIPNPNKNPAAGQSIWTEQ